MMSIRRVGHDAVTFQGLNGSGWDGPEFIIESVADWIEQQ